MEAPAVGYYAHSISRSKSCAEAQIIPFQRQFQIHEQDSSKFEHIWDHEMSGVLNRAIAGFQRFVLRKNQFQTPDQGIEAQHNFLMHGNPLYAFLSENLVEDDTAKLTLPQLRNAYEVWAKQQNIKRLAVLNNTLKRRLESLGFQICILNGYPCIQGHKLKG